MSRFRKESGNKTPELSTASLPDIVFMLLFFFIVATVEREETFQVNFVRPTATQKEEVEDRSTVQFIYVGKRIEGAKTNSAAYQMNGSIMPTLKEAGEAAVDHLAKFSGNKKPVFSLKIDEGTDMDDVNNLKLELIEAGVTEVLYSIRDEEQKQ